jgi:flagellar basal-body rod modification protein FlgD
MFMSLLVAQLKNQDPLSPQDGAAFVAQLAQFNSLDQLVGIRDSIDQLTRLLQTQRDTTPNPGTSGSPESTPKV